MKIIINKNSKEDLEKLKKIYIALGKDFGEIDQKAIARGHAIKDEKKLKQEIKAESEKPDKPKGNKP
jgi:hypothetical protein